MIRVYESDNHSRFTDCLCWSMVLRHVPAGGTVEVGYDATIGVYVTLSGE